MDELEHTVADVKERISTRAMEQKDLGIVIELDALVFGNSRSAYFERRLAELSDADAPTRLVFLVAEHQGAIAGFVMGALAYGEFGLTQVTAILDTIAVHPDQQRHGVGRQLIEAFIERSKHLGAVSVYTLVSWDNWMLLKAFHSLGFELASTIPLERRIVTA